MARWSKITFPVTKLHKDALTLRPESCMNFFNYLAIFFIVIACTAIGYKMRYHWNRKNNKNHHPLLFFLNKYFTINFLLPVAFRRTSTDVLEKRRQKRANLALLIFYLAFAFTLLASVFAK